jgi:hypothetical protein
VSHDLRAVSSGLHGLWGALARVGYALTDDASIGLPEGFRGYFSDAYFNDCTLRHDEGDRPVDRQRARDVIRYQRREGELRMREYETITITDRAGIAGKRDHARVMLLDDPRAENLVRTFLSLVPPERRRAEGTFGVNLFRTFTDVVTKPHRDDEEFVILYVLDRTGRGAESYLYEFEALSAEGEPVAAPLLRHQLSPGEVLIFEDKRFKHGATPLIAPPGRRAMRDVLVCTVDYSATYLDAEAA